MLREHKVLKDQMEILVRMEQQGQQVEWDLQEPLETAELLVLQEVLDLWDHLESMEL